MNHCLSKRFLLLLLLALSVLAFGCKKPPVPPPVPAPVITPPPPPAPTITLNADRTTITAGQPAVLSYTATNATSVTIAPGIGAVQPATTGTRTVNPTATTTFTARAEGPGGTAQSAAVNITVTPVATPLPPAPPPSTPPTAAPNVISRTTAEIFRDTMQPILFDYDKATIRPSEESKLLAEAAYLKQNPNLRFSIEGHADERGSQEYNVALGDERSAAVRKFLIAQGIAENRMTPISYGEERPICRQQTESCFQDNRRAAFTLTQ